MTAAATTGYLRYAAGRHYPTDILVGAAMGAFVGYLVPSLHELEGDGAGGLAGEKSRRSMTLGITQGLIRRSVGLEDTGDRLADLRGGLAAI